MLPLQQIAKLFYENHPTGRFDTEISYYLAKGFVFISPDYAILARACDTTIPETYLGGYDFWEKGEPNAWFCAYAAGDLSKFGDVIQSLHVQYPYVVWGRIGRDGWRIARREVFLRLIKYKSFKQ